MLGVEQKKGDPHHLLGRMVAYARINPNATHEPNPNRKASPLDGMIKNGILAVTGDFETQHDFRDFLKREFNSSVSEGLGEMFGIDQDSLKSKLEEFSNMEIIPVPARIMVFADEQEILEEDADIYYLGSFNVHSHAHLCVTSFPIYYQARFREQQANLLQNEIHGMLSQIETDSSRITQPLPGDPVVLHLKGDLSGYNGHLLELMTNQVIPNLVYNTGNTGEFEQSMHDFKRFMRPYKYPGDIHEIERILQNMRLGNGGQIERRRLELMCRKISALHHEEFELLGPIERELGMLL